MSGPFGINMTVISGRKFSGEIVVAASTFLSRNLLSIDPIANDTNVRKEFLKALDVFKKREGFYYTQRPDDFAKRLAKPSKQVSTKGFFWLALDPEGEAIAKDIFAANGDLPDKPVHQSVRKLSLIEGNISPPPQTYIQYDVWEELRKKLFSFSVQYSKAKSKNSYSSQLNENVPLLSEEKLYCDWFETLYESLIPWQDTIKRIQSDLS